MHILPYTNGIYNMDVNTMDVFTNLGRQLSRQLGKEEEEMRRRRLIELIGGVRGSGRDTT